MKNDLNYWCSFAHQALGIYIAAAWNVTNDSLVAGFMMQACAQLDLMNFRLQILPEKTKVAGIQKVPKREIQGFENKVIRDNVRHHLTICKLVAKNNMGDIRDVIQYENCLSQRINNL